MLLNNRAFTCNVCDVTLVLKVGADWMWIYE
jgi:competence CoiA-like predicted nuclease